MAKFKDGKGREWFLKMDYYLATKIEDELDIPILSKLQEVEFSPRHCVEMVWILIEERAEKLGVDPADFGKSVSGEQMEELCDALLEAISFFYEGLSPQQAQLLRMMQKVRRNLGEMMEEHLELISDERCLTLLASAASSLGDSLPGNLENFVDQDSQQMMDLMLEAFQKTADKKLNSTAATSRS